MEVGSPGLLQLKFCKILKDSNSQFPTLPSSVCGLHTHVCKMITAPPCITFLFQVGKKGTGPETFPIRLLFRERMLSPDTSAYVLLAGTGSQSFPQLQSYLGKWIYLHNKLGILIIISNKIGFFFFSKKEGENRQWLGVSVTCPQQKNQKKQRNTSQLFLLQLFFHLFSFSPPFS